MRQNFDSDKVNSILENITYLVGSAENVRYMTNVPAKRIFDEQIMSFLNDISKELLENRENKVYSDIVTLGFWLRWASICHLKERFGQKDNYIRQGRGVVFHIAPSNVPVNYVYSLVCGLLSGNANIVRIPSRDFPQIAVINHAIENALEAHPDVKPYVCLVRYNRNKEVNDLLSSIANLRVLWGGDETIEELRTSPLPARSGEITFADRYSLAVIDSDAYVQQKDKDKVTEGFYNDTYLTDQNACTSPKMVIWMGSEKKREQAKKEFWDRLYRLVRRKYYFQDIQGVQKLTDSYRLMMTMPGAKNIIQGDNRTVRVCVPQITDDLVNFMGNSGYFLEYDCENILEIKPLCNHEKCQTISYFGEKNMLMPLILSGVKGIDRVVPIGQTMNFDLIWDGYDLISQMTRILYIL